MKHIFLWIVPLALFTGVLFLSRTQQIIFSFSPQGTIDPVHLVQEVDPSETTAIFDNQTIPIPSYVANLPSPSQVLGDTSEEKRIEVDLTNQRLYAFEGGKMVYNFLVSTGKWGKTPTGIFHIWVKLRATKMSGGSQALHTYYYLPNVPYVMFFANDEVPKWKGFSLHGTYWHSNFGRPMSHGCVNMKTEEVAQLYQWARPDLQGKSSIYANDDNPGTQVVIYGTAPDS